MAILVTENALVSVDKNCLVYKALENGNYFLNISFRNTLNHDNKKKVKK
jgi:hypothetical protein